VIDERELTELFSEAAEIFDVPADGPDRIIDAAEDRAPKKERRPKRTPLWRQNRIAVAAAVSVVVIGFAAVIGVIQESQHNTPQFHSVGRAQSGSSADMGVSTGDSAGTAATAGDASAAGTTGGPVPVQPQPLTDTAKVVKTGSAQIQVRKGAVGPTMDRLNTLAVGVRGYVAETKTNEGDSPSGSATLRVPVNTFEDVVSQVRKLGTVQSVDTHGQDVTAQYTDLQARLSALIATRDQLNTVLRKATSIGDILSVQDRINQVQTQIEQLQGQQKVLDDQTSYASLAVSVSQEGTPIGAPHEPSGIAKAWNDARHGFTSGLETIIAGSGTALVLLLCGVALFFLGRWAWIVLRRRLV